MSRRNRGWRRRKDYYKGRRKKNIVLSIYKVPWYKHDGQYIKGKIHCSCPICTSKTRDRKRAWSGSIVHYKHSDQQKMDRMHSQIEEYEKINLKEGNT